MTSRPDALVLPRGPELWDPSRTEWTDENTHGLFVCEFIEATIRLTKGPRAGELVRLRHWQGDLICDIFRLDPLTGRRLYTNYELWIPRKNSKSLLGSGLALDGLFDEPGAEVYSCAADKLQAKIVFKEARAAVDASPELSAQLKKYVDAIENPATGSVYRALSAEAFTKEGLNPSRVVFDELHAQPNDELWNVMNQGSGTRERPLIVSLSTFGSRTDSLGQDSLGYQQYKYCKAVAAGEVDDPSFGSRIYETPAEADHRDESVWHAANPALGDFLRIEDMRDRCTRMRESDFRTKRLNIWVSSSNPALPFGVWESRADPNRVVSETEPVVLGFDGAWKGDHTALVGCTLDGHIFKIQIWAPDVHDPDYRAPIDAIEAAVKGACKKYRVKRIICDPYRWEQSLWDLLNRHGLPIEEYPTNAPARMIPAWQTFYDALMDGKLTHDGDPTLAKHMDNLVLKTDHRGARPTKDSDHSPRKIDGAIASIIAYDVAMKTQPKTAAQAWLDGMLEKKASEGN